MPSLDHRLERTIVINAPRETVFRYFSDSSRWAAWLGAGSTIDARAGGTMLINFPGGVQAAGQVSEVSAPERIVFTYGFVTGTPIPAGGSRVTIALAAEGGATRLTLTHELPNAAVRDEHVQGWRYQLSVFSNVAADEMARDAAAMVDGWFSAWAEPDAAARERALAGIAAPGIAFRDRYSNISGLNDLLPHVAATQRFMPGVRMTRTGDVRHCQGTILANFAVTGPDGAERGNGTNVFVLGPDGLIASATGILNPPATH